MAAAVIAEEPASVADARAKMEDEAAVLGGPPEPVDEVTDLEAAPVGMRRYTPAGARGAVVYFHGGG